MDGRIPSGHAGLDTVLGGGLPEHAINLVMGLPGSGKTTLAQQYVFETATSERPAFYLSTVSEPFEKMVRYGQTLSFFDPRSVGRSVFYEDLGRTLSKRGLAALPERISALLREWRPGLIVIDSFKALRAFSPSDEEFRRFLFDLAGRLSAYPVTSLWVGEYSEADMSDAPELAVADAIISLSTEQSGERELRLFQVLKLRGSVLLPGRHVYRLSGDGVAVYPRLGAGLSQTQDQPPPKRQSTGIAALDEMLGHDFWSQTTTLVAGPSGSGKTLFGLSFIFNGLAYANGGIIATFHESKTQLRPLAESLGWSIDQPGVEIVRSSPIESLPDEWAYELFDKLDRTGAVRVFVDGAEDLRFACRDDASFREYLYSLTERLRLRGVTLMLASEATDPVASTTLGELSVSHVCDTVVCLEHALAPGGPGRTLTVLKARTPQRVPGSRHFRIADGTIALERPPAAEPGSP